MSDDGGADATARRALDRAISDADQLLLVYQPIHDLRRNASVYAAEALLRQRRENGEIREASIISRAAEKSRGPELFVLDSILVRSAYEDAARWQSHDRPDVRLNVNLSPREFQEGDVLGRLSELLTSCGIVPSRVNLEITETAYIREPERTSEVLEELVRLGIHIWLDDFGTGHSSLLHVQHFPIEGIKLPAEFVAPLDEDRRARAIVRSLLGLAHDLEVEVIAEGVETPGQLQFLQDHGCDYIQGFLFSRPMELPAFVELLKGETRGV